MNSSHPEGDDELDGVVMNVPLGNGTIIGSNQSCPETTCVRSSILASMRLLANLSNAKITITENDLNDFRLPSGSVAVEVDDNALTVNYGEGWDIRFAIDSSKPPPGRTFHSTANPGSRVDMAFTGMSHPSLELAF